MFNFAGALGMVTLLTALCLAWLSGRVSGKGKMNSERVDRTIGVALPAFFLTLISISLLSSSAGDLAEGHGRDGASLSVGSVYYVDNVFRNEDKTSYPYLVLLSEEGRDDGPVLYRMRLEPPKPCFTLLLRQGYAPAPCDKALSGKPTP